VKISDPSHPWGTATAAATTTEKQKEKKRKKNKKSWQKFLVFCNIFCDSWSLVFLFFSVGLLVFWQVLHAN